MILAIVNDYLVTQITADIDPSLYGQYAQNAQAAIDVTSTVPQPQVGWTFTGSILIPPAGFVQSWKITNLAMRERFTTSELLTLYTAMSTNPMLQVMKDNQMAATYIDLTRSDTIAGVEYLVSLGIITSARATVILTTPPIATELYQG